MPIPKADENLRKLVISKVESAGGTLHRDKLLQDLRTHFGVTEEEYREKDSTRYNRLKFVHRVDSSIAQAVKRGELYHPQRGYIAIKSKAGDQLSPPPVTKTPSMPSPSIVPTQSRHEELVERIIDIGNLIGKYGEKGTRYDNTDAVWKDNAQAWNPSHVFEVQDKGNLYSALTKLQGALQKSKGVKPFIVVTDDSERHKVKDMIEQYYPMLKNKIHIWMGSQVDNLWESLNSQDLDICKALFSD